MELKPLSAIFLSASIRTKLLGTYHEIASPSLIRNAVRQSIITISKEHQIVCGGDPPILDFLINAIEDVKSVQANSFVLYHSSYFQYDFVEKEHLFECVTKVHGVRGDKAASLVTMRKKMLSRNDLVGAVFIGGMDGVEVEHQIFKYYHPNTKVLAISSPGAGSLNLALDNGYFSEENLENEDFESIIQNYLTQIPIRAY